MSARRFRKTWWVDFSYKGHRTRVRSPDNSKAGTEAYEALLRQKLARGEPIDKKERTDVTFGEFVEEWFTHYVQANNKESEKRSKRSILDKHLIPFFGKMKLSEIQSGIVERYKSAKKMQDMHPKSINNELAVLRKCLHSAAEWGKIPSVPIIKALRTPPLVTDFLAESEEEALLSRVTNPLAHAMILTALHTGMRIGELMGLEWQAIDFGNRQITVCKSVVRNIPSSPKSNRIRHIPMTDTLVDELLPMRKASGLVFPRPNGSWLSDIITTKLIQKACDEAGVRRVGWHLLRHTFASRLVSRGIPIRAVQQLLGHSSVTMTERYAHLAPTVLSDAIRVLEKTPFGKIQATGGQRDMNFVLSQLFHESSKYPEIIGK